MADSAASKPVPRTEKRVDQSASGFRKTGIIIILAFVALLFFTIFLDVAFFSQSPAAADGSQASGAMQTALSSVWCVLYTLLLNIAAAGITIGAGTVLYGHFDFVQYVKNTLSKVILEHEFVEQLNDEQKEKLMQKLQKHLVYHDTVSGNDTLFDFVNTEVRGLTQGPYYEQMRANFSCRREGDQIVKHIIRQMDINLQQAADYRFDLVNLTRCYFYGSAKEAEANPPFRVLNLSINGTSYKDKIEYTVTPTDDERGYGFITQYDFKSDVNREELISQDRRIRVNMEYETLVPLSDKTLGFRTYFPCRHLDSTFVYSNDLKVTPDIFCFKDRKANGMLDRERIQIVQNDNCISISFPDWLLPGDGIIYYIEAAKPQDAQPETAASQDADPGNAQPGGPGPEEADRVTSGMSVSGKAAVI